MESLRYKILCNRQQYVKVGCVKTAVESIMLELGIPQGLKLSPFLYLRIGGVIPIERAFSKC